MIAYLRDRAGGPESFGAETQAPRGIEPRKAPLRPGMVRRRSDI